MSDAMPSGPDDTVSSGPLDDVTIPGVEYTPLARHEDDRGWFLKLFQSSHIAELGGDTSVGEVFVSSSSEGTVRGLHFQLPPHDHAKTVACLTGAVLDVVVDLRTGSPTEGKAARFVLVADDPARIHMPAGVAHGFQALTDDTIMAYVTSTEHAPVSDAGIRWDSVGVDWPRPVRNVSDRDGAFPTLAAFRSPFVFGEGRPEPGGTSRTDRSAGSGRDESTGATDG